MSPIKSIVLSVVFLIKTILIVNDSCTSAVVFYSELKFFYILQRIH